LFVMVFYLSKKKIIKKYVFVSAALLLLLAFVVIYSGEDDIATRAETMTGVDGDPSFLSRVKIWQGTLDMIKHNPVIGTGIGTLTWGFPRYRPAGLNARIVHAHNDYLHMTAEMGLLSLPLMLWIIVIVLKKGFFLVRRPIYAGITVGLMSIFVHGLVDFNFHIPANMMLITVLCAIIMKYDESA
ncbi:MAG: O-antigen ligase family protein, partial [Candidatus Omnitrophota bacterium]|nr:O-antigen ligase family protein [Candidatus Omnitrophota bacterium]